MKKTTLKYIAASSCLSLMFGFKLNKENDFKNLAENHSECCENFEIIAHRGFSSRELENSKEAILSAEENKCTDKIEIDIRLTKDNKIILAHDENNISNLDYKDIDIKPCLKSIEALLMWNDDDIMKELKVNRCSKMLVGTKITLDEVLNIVNTSLIIDIKFENNEEAFIKEIFNVIRNKDNKIEFQSSNFEALKLMKSMNPNYKYFAIISNKEQLLKTKNQFDGYTIKSNLISYNLVKEYLDNDKTIYIWTINSINSFERIKRILKEIDDDVSYITDYPDALCGYQSKIKR
ncbi:MAG: glycerophosphodiester phosphodiesterase family protein [Bacilli bacterium]